MDDACTTKLFSAVMSGDDLSFGERVSDRCTADGRPQALGACPVVRK